MKSCHRNIRTKNKGTCNGIFTQSNSINNASSSMHISSKINNNLRINSNNNSITNRYVRTNTTAAIMCAKDISSVLSMFHLTKPSISDVDEDRCADDDGG